MSRAPALGGEGNGAAVMWDWSAVEAMTGPVFGLLVAVLVIGVVITVGWFIADSFRNKS